MYCEVGVRICFFVYIYVVVPASSIEKTVFSPLNCVDNPCQKSVDYTGM